MFRLKTLGLMAVSSAFLLLCTTNGMSQLPVTKLCTSCGSDSNLCTKNMPCNVTIEINGVVQTVWGPAAGTETYASCGGKGTACTEWQMTKRCICDVIGYSHVYMKTSIYSCR